MFFFFSPIEDEQVGWTTHDDGSWYSTLEFPHITALQVEADKTQEFITKLEQISSGNWIVKYRGLTDEEKKERHGKSRQPGRRSGKQNEQA